MSAAHRTPTYRRLAPAITAHARANPDTRCWRCGRTLPEHEPHKTGRPARWTAGHLNDSEIDGPLAAEASTCNYTNGGWNLVNGRRQGYEPYEPRSGSW